MILVGTSGYHYKDWVGPVYPKGTAAAQYLKLYARRFNLVELNFSYYTMPNPQALERMLAAGTENLRFNIKAHASITHKTSAAGSLPQNPPALFDPEQVEGACRTFKAGIDPLVQAGRLGVVLLQFPYSFHYTKPSRLYLAKVCDWLKNLPLAVEFRNSEWFCQSVYRELTARKIALVAVDEPPLPHLPEPRMVSTTDTGYVRFHGRNQQAWWSSDNTGRYDYLYSAAELEYWVEAVGGFLKKLKTLMLVFNNHFRGQAVVNAEQIRAALKTRGHEVV